MKKVQTMYCSLTKHLERLDFLYLLFLRLILAYGFYEPAMMKIRDAGSIAVWFEQMKIPYPLFFAHFVGIIEFLGVIFLSLGFFTRLISVALMIILLVAIKVLHWENGFRAYYNGFEIHLYYIAMLFVLLCKGAGKYSIDNLIRLRYKLN